MRRNFCRSSNFADLWTSTNTLLVAILGSPLKLHGGLWVDLRGKGCLKRSLSFSGTLVVLLFVLLILKKRPVSDWVGRVLFSSLLLLSRAVVICLRWSWCDLKLKISASLVWQFSLTQDIAVAVCGSIEWSELNRTKWSIKISVVISYFQASEQVRWMTREAQC